MLERFSRAMRGFFSGRYGADALSRALMAAAVCLMVLGWIGGRFVWRYLELLTVLAYGILIWNLYRMYSRNFQKRRAENARYLRVANRLKDRQHRYFRCPNCRQSVRVPRGKGTIKIHCPSCHQQFVKKT